VGALSTNQYRIDHVPSYASAGKALTRAPRPNIAFPLLLTPRTPILGSRAGSSGSSSSERLREAVLGLVDAEGRLVVRPPQRRTPLGGRRRRRRRARPRVHASQLLRPVRGLRGDRAALQVRAPGRRHRGLCQRLPGDHEPVAVRGGGRGGGRRVRRLPRRYHHGRGLLPARSALGLPRRNHRRRLLRDWAIAHQEDLRVARLRVARSAQDPTPPFGRGGERRGFG